VGPAQERFLLYAGCALGRPGAASKIKIVGPVLEPAAGVGHLVRELRRGHGLEVIASDLHAYEGALIPDIEIQDIRAIDSLRGFQWAISNLPYREQDALAAHPVALGARDGCSVALLTRAEWIVARRRRNLVHEHPNFAGILFLTSRPRWSEINLALPRLAIIFCGPCGQRRRGQLGLSLGYGSRAR
jgi:hypothetical protein